MFFIVSKILQFLIVPFHWVVGLMIYALFVKNRARKRKASILALGLLLFFTNSFLFNKMAQWWEVKTITADEIVRPYKVGILLGGYSSSTILPSHDRMNFSGAGNRFFNTYELYRTGKIEKILLTGGSGDVLQKRAREAPRVADFLMRIGVPEEDIIVEGESRNTYENAVFSKRILEEQNINGNYLLITSAWHMYRAKACFDKAGLSYTPYSVDFASVKDSYRPNKLFFPNPMVIGKWGYFIKEWVGLVAYKMKGYI